LLELLKEEMHCLQTLCEGKMDVALWSCVEGNMGRAWVDSILNPTVAIVIVADFCFLLGSIKGNKYDNSKKELLDKCKGKIIVPEDISWVTLIEKYYIDNVKRFNRYSIKKEDDVFHRDKLNEYIAAVESEFQIERIDESIYYKVLKDKFMEDCCSNYSTFEEFSKHGIGYTISHNDEIVSAASSYSYCEGSIEITIGTKSEYRRKGLALAVASRLILECMERNIYPRWDAANLGSVALAEKLGYHFDKEYEVCSIS
jgi:hypothetical protein